MLDDVVVGPQEQKDIYMKSVIMLKEVQEALKLFTSPTTACAITWKRRSNYKFYEFHFRFVIVEEIESERKIFILYILVKRDSQILVDHCVKHDEMIRQHDHFASMNHQELCSYFSKSTVSLLTNDTEQEFTVKLENGSLHDYFKIPKIILEKEVR